MGKPLTWIALNQQLDNAAAKLVLVTMAALAKEHKDKPSVVYAKKETIMKFTCLSRASYYRAVSDLKTNGSITQFDNNYGQVAYTLNLLSQIETDSQTETAESQIETDESQIETPLYSNPNTNPNTYIIEKNIFMEKVKMGVPIPMDFAEEWYDECTRKGHFQYPNGNIRPFGRNVSMMIRECQLWYNKKHRNEKPESTYEKKSRLDALTLLLKQHPGRPDSDMQASRDDFKEYKGYKAEHSKLLKELAGV